MDPHLISSYQHISKVKCSPKTTCHFKRDFLFWDASIYNCKLRTWNCGRFILYITGTRNFDCSIWTKTVWIELACVSWLLHIPQSEICLSALHHILTFLISLYIYLLLTLQHASKLPNTSFQLVPGPYLFNKTPLSMLTGMNQPY